MLMLLAGRRTLRPRQPAELRGLRGRGAVRVSGACGRGRVGEDAEVRWGFWGVVQGLSAVVGEGRLSRWYVRCESKVWSVAARTAGDLRKRRAGPCSMFLTDCKILPRLTAPCFARRAKPSLLSLGRLEIGLIISRVAPSSGVSKLYKRQRPSSSSERCLVDHRAAIRPVQRARTPEWAARTAYAFDVEGLAFDPSRWPPCGRTAGPGSERFHQGAVVVVVVRGGKTQLRVRA